MKVFSRNFLEINRESSCQPFRMACRTNRPWRLGNHRLAGLLLIFLFATLFQAVGVSAQQNNNGFEVTLAATASSEELNSQEDLWVLEVSFKRMRMIPVNFTDPKTGKTNREYVMYLVYKVVNRPLKREIDSTPSTPQNDEDRIPPHQFVPEATLVTEDNGVQNIYVDTIIPEAQKIIQRRESRKPSDPIYKNSVNIVGDIPKITPYDAKSESTLYGMLMWRGVDPKADYFTVFLTGFNSAYRKIKGPDGKDLIVRRVIQQQYWRPGDEFDQNEKEFRHRGEPKWIYRPDEPQTKPVATSGSTNRPQKVGGVK